MKRRIFMDTAFLIAVLDESDTYHNVAAGSYKKLINEEFQRSSVGTYAETLQRRKVSTESNR